MPFYAIQLPGHRTVTASLHAGKVIFGFMTPLKKEDIKNGEAIPRARGVRRHGRLLTIMSISPEAARALRDELNALFPPEDDSSSKAAQL